MNEQNKTADGSAEDEKNTAERVITVAVAGLGPRGNAYSAALGHFKDRAKIVACADVLPDRVERFGDRYDVPREMRFPSAEEMLKRGRLADVLIVATPDRHHFAHASAALDAGCHLLLEKPVSPVLSECFELADKAQKKSRRVIVCHVLRYTAFYRRLKQLVDSGVIGDIVSIKADEKVGYWHQAHSFVRGNWANSEKSSPMILQKCCHDMDIFHWLVGRRCAAVSSFGSLTHFKPSEAPKGAPERCTEACPEYHTCPYSVECSYIESAKDGYFGWPNDVVTQIPTMEALLESLETGPYGRCVYHCDNDVVDHQVVNLLFEGGATLSFTMCAFDSGEGRETHVMGTKGEIIADNGKDSIKVNVFRGKCEVYESVSSQAVGSGHGGGDFGIVRDLVSLIEGGNDASSSMTDISETLESHVIALAAEESRKNGGALVDTADFVSRMRRT
ncbi:MAG: Gfo/Idh/MocA family oxidoreductase [Clostridia bacterium]|nr:Gfo/Idh/MocA family oxidoreductase [Clostridia bacterium]